MSLASASGVSHTTVSAALRGTGHMSQEMRLKILKLAREKGYFPHAAAQVLRSRTSGYLGLILGAEDPVREAENGVFSPMLGAFLDTCERASQKYHIEFYGSRSKAHSVAPVQLSNSSVDGVIVTGLQSPLKAWLETESNAPWVALEEPAPYAYLSAIDDGYGEAVHYLHQLGHRRFAFFGWDHPISFHQLAIKGFRTTLQALGLNDSLVSLVPVDVSYDDYASFVAAEARRLLIPGNNPTAILCQGFDIARVVHLILSEVGLRVPRDVSLIAAGPRSIAVQSYPRLSFIEPDYSTMMSEALAVLKQLVAEEPLEKKTVMVPTRLVHLESTGPAPTV